MQGIGIISISKGQFRGKYSILDMVSVSERKCERV